MRPVQESTRYKKKLRAWEETSTESRKEKQKVRGRLHSHRVPIIHTRFENHSKLQQTTPQKNLIVKWLQQWVGTWGQS